VVSKSRTRRKRNNLKNNTNFLIKCWKFVSNKMLRICELKPLKWVVPISRDYWTYFWRYLKKFQELRILRKNSKNRDPFLERILRQAWAPELSASTMLIPARLQECVAVFYWPEGHQSGECCFVLLTRGWGRLETRHPVCVLLCFIDPRVRKIRTWIEESKKKLVMPPHNYVRNGQR